VNRVSQPAAPTREREGRPELGGQPAGRDLADAVPPTVLVVMGVGSVQFGAALARTLFHQIGPAGTVMVRVVFAAILLGLLWRPRLRGHGPRALAIVAAFGVSLAAMNLAFYESLARIPLGIAVTFEFVGPLAVALVGSRSLLHLVWVALAAGGIVLLAAPGGAHLDALGVVLALVAGVCWGAYILLSARTGRLFSGGDGLALAMGLAALLLVPVGVVGGGGRLLHPGPLAVGLGVAILSSAIPYTLEMEALRRLPERVFGVLMSIEPAVAALAGFLVLGQVLHVRQLGGIVLVMLASAGASRGARVPAPRDA
jgi:inner membrane transporter RhtA